MPREGKSISANTSSSTGSLTDRKPRRVEATAAGTKVLQKFTRLGKSQSSPKPITRPKIIHHPTTHPLSSFQIAFWRSSQNLASVKWPKSRPDFRVLLASVLMPSRPPIPRAPIKIDTPFVMKPQATLHRGCASRVFIRTRQTRWTR